MDINIQVHIADDTRMEIEQRYAPHGKFCTITFDGRVTLFFRDMADLERLGVSIMDFCWHEHKPKQEITRRDLQKDLALCREYDQKVLNGGRATDSKDLSERAKLFYEFRKESKVGWMQALERAISAEEAVHLLLEVLDEAIDSVMKADLEKAIASGGAKNDSQNQ